jgi:nitric oxide synthase oxygenase domain/subunit
MIPSSGEKVTEMRAGGSWSWLCCPVSPYLSTYTPHLKAAVVSVNRSEYRKDENSYPSSADYVGLSISSDEVFVALMPH